MPPNSGQSSAWHSDTGASNHVTQEQNIHQGQAFEGVEHVFVGSGQGLTISSQGSYFKSPFNPNYTLVLKNLLHVPSITKNMLSVSQFCKDNKVKFEFDDACCLVKSQVSE